MPLNFHPFYAFKSALWGTFGFWIADLSYRFALSFFTKLMAGCGP